MDLDSTRIAVASSVVAAMMAVSAASFATIATLWQEDAPSARETFDAADGEKAVATPIEHDRAILERARPNAGKWI